MDDQYQREGGGGSSLKTTNEGPGAKSRKKKSISKISKAEFGLIKALFYYSMSQYFYGIIYCKRGAFGFEKENSALLY